MLTRCGVARKFEDGRVAAVGTIAPGRGRKPEIDQSIIDAIVNDTLHTIPDDEATDGRLGPWVRDTVSARTPSRRSGRRGISGPGRRDLQAVHGSGFEEKLIDVVGLYLDPPNAPSCSVSMRKRSARRSIVHSRRSRSSRVVQRR